MPDLRVVVADDHYLVREGVKQVLELADDVRVVASVGDPEALGAAVGEHRPDVVVTDIRMPPEHRTEGIAAAHRIRAEHPATGVVVLSAHADEAYAYELFRDGTVGLAYLLKERVGDQDQLLAAVRAVATGGSVIDPDVVESMVSRRRRQETSRLATLTAREIEVLEKMAGGLSNPAIGAALHLSVSAVEKHVSSIFTKLGLVEEATHRRVAAVLAFLDGR